MKRLDRYIIGKFLSTFFVAILLIILLTIAFDISEKLDGFIGKGGLKPTMNEIMMDYYINFIPYFVTLFSPLFVFISVIFFTSRMATRMELISILDTGTSFTRMLMPFMFSAVVIASMSWSLTNFVLPRSNEVRIGFERKYFSRVTGTAMHFHREVDPGEYVYVERFDLKTNTGTKFAYEKLVDEQLRLKIMSHTIRYDSLRSHWVLDSYIVREMDGVKEKMRKGDMMDTTFNFDPSFFKQDLKQIEMMTNRELYAFIEDEQRKGSKFVNVYKIEKHQRNATPFSTIILTLLAVPIASRKVRGGIGFHLAMGVALAFTYIFMQKVTTTYAVNNVLSPFTAVWLPNFLYAIVGLVLTKFAQK